MAVFGSIDNFLGQQLGGKLADCCLERGPSSVSDYENLSSRMALRRRWSSTHANEWA